MMLKENRQIVLDELTLSLGKIDEREYANFVNQLIKKRRILIVAVGRVLISMKAWIKRMAHLDMDINYVGSETEMPLSKGDLLIVASSSGESAVPVTIARIAKQKGADIGYIGCSQDSTVCKMADFCLMLAGKTKLGRDGEFRSVQPMSTLFEQQLYLLGDMITLDIMKKKGFGEEQIRNRHANLE